MISNTKSNILSKEILNGQESYGWHNHFGARVLGRDRSAGNLEDLENLGGLILRDKNLSINQNQSCQTCHHQSAGFADPDNLKDPAEFPVSEGSIAGLFGGRNAPTAAYAGFSPVFHNSI